MKRAIQKLFIVIVAFLTFGAISPGHEIWSQLQTKDNSNHTDGHIDDNDYYLDYSDTNEQLAEVQEVYPFSSEVHLIGSAKDLSYMKFGSKIGPVIMDEFDEVIFPKIEEAISSVFRDTGESRKQILSITDKPAGNYSEKIFHVFDQETNNDVIQFHVRTEKRPLDGYYFNFHYHTFEDDFSTHHSLGDIYWSKNTPPRWLS